MDKINKLNNVISVLRTHVSKNLNKKDKGGDVSRTKGTKNAERASVDVLEKRVIERIRKLDEKNDEYPQHSIRIIVESIITWEFGDKVLNDPEFETLVTNVIDNMKSSSKLTVMLDEFIDGGISSES